MTTEEWIKRQDAKIKAIQKDNKPLEIAVRSIMSVQSKRIFIEGKNADGGIIGNYEGGEIYVSPEQNKGLPKFPLKGKSGETEFKNGKKHKTGYFANYRSFKESIGRNKKIKTVDLFLTGQLQRNWANAESLNQAQARKINSHNYIVALKEENYVKTKRYGDVFSLSKNERKLFLKVLQFELTKALK